MSAKKLKEIGHPLTLDGLRAMSAQYLQDEPFQNTLASCASADVGTLIRNGVFEQRMEERRKDRSFAARLPALQEQWKLERSERQSRTRQICDQVIAARRAVGDWPTEPAKKPQPKQNGKKSEIEMAAAKKKAPASKKASAKAKGKPQVKEPGKPQIKAQEKASGKTQIAQVKTQVQATGQDSLKEENNAIILPSSKGF